MKRAAVLSAVLAIAMLFGACSSARSDTAGERAAPVIENSDGEETKMKVAIKLTADEAYEKMNGEDSVIVLDVRTREEYAEKHIPGAMLLPNEEIGDGMPEQLPVLNASILIYCRSGNRSAQAAKKLTDMGYANVYDFGGINDWPYETQSGAYEEAEKDGTLASFSTYDLNGIPVDERVFADYKLTMINIWATFCGPCLREMPELGALSEEYKDKHVQILGIVADITQGRDGVYSQKRIAAAQELAQQTGAAYRHLLPSAELISAKLGSVNAVPETIFVNSEGKIIGESYVGARSGAEWAEIIDGMLAEAENDS